MSEPNQLDQLIAETVPRTSLRDSLVMFLGGLARLLTERTANDLAGELEAKKGTIADALVANTPVAPAGLGAGPTFQNIPPIGPSSGVPPSTPFEEAQLAQVAKENSAALLPHEVAVGTPQIDPTLDELHKRITADAELRRLDVAAVEADDARLAADSKL